MLHRFFTTSLISIVGACLPFVQTARAATPDAADSQESATIIVDDPALRGEKLILNQTQLRRLKGGENHFYTVTPTAGTCLRLHIEQRRIDVEIEIRDRTGKLLKHIDRPSGSSGREIVTLVASESGDLIIKVFAWQSFAPLGDYQIGYREIASSDHEIERSRAEDLTSHGERLRSKSDRASKRQALDKFAAALEIWQMLGERYEQTVICYGLGWTHFDLSNYAEAALWFQRGAIQMIELGDEYGAALNFAGLGRAQYSLGDHDFARHNLRRSVEVLRRLKQDVSLAGALFGLGTSDYLLEDDVAAAQNLTGALRLRETLGDVRGQGLTLITLANVEIRHKNYETAMHLLARSLALCRSINNLVCQTEALATKGWAQLALNQFGEAQQTFEQALTLNRKLDNRLGEAKILHGLSAAQTESGDLDLARINIDAALDLIEALRGETINLRQRTLFLATVQDFYEHRIDLLMRMHARVSDQGFDRSALETAERSRSRGLLDLLERRGFVRADPLARELLSESQKLENDSTFALLEYNWAARDDRAQTELARLAALVQNASAQFLEVDFNLARRLKIISETSAQTFLSAAEVQNLLDDNTMLLEYALTEKHAYLWVITKNKIISHRLGYSEKVRRAALAFYRCVSSPPNGTAKGDSCGKAGSDLSEILLRPIADELKRKRLIVVAQDALQMVPFAALSDPRDRNAFLLESHEIITLPSASVLARIRRQKTARRNSKIAIFADPVFSANDNRFNRSNAAVNKFVDSPPTTKKRAFQSTEKTNALGLRRLFASRFEAERVAALFAPGAASTKLDFAASREAVLQTDWREFAVLHFATHAVINNDEPESSAIALAMIMESGQPANGWLRSSDVLSLDLNVELTVLSACRSESGKNLKGEGLMNLTRVFFAAGARRVITSRWALEDKATAELMARFYRRLDKNRLQNASAALRATQLEMRQDPRWRLPFYWATFTIHGDWQPD